MSISSWSWPMLHQASPWLAFVPGRAKPSSSAVALAHEDGWRCWAGMAKNYFVDQGSEFRGVFQDWAGDHDIPIKLSATGAHWQLSLLERRIEIIKEMSKKVFDALNVVGEMAVIVAVNAITEAINRQAFHHGVSPQQ